MALVAEGWLTTNDGWRREYCKGVVFGHFNSQLGLPVLHHNSASPLAHPCFPTSSLPLVSIQGHTFLNNFQPLILPHNHLANLKIERQSRNSSFWTIVFKILLAFQALGGGKRNDRQQVECDSSLPDPHIPIITLPDPHKDSIGR